MINVSYIGRFGNNLFQYSLARIINYNNGFGIITSGLYQDILPNIQGKEYYSPIDIYEGHQINFKHLCSNTPRQIRLQGFFQRYEYYKDYKDNIKLWLSNIPRKTNITPTPKDIVLHVRGGDLWGKEGSVNEHHVPCPYKYYKKILDSSTYDKIYIITEHKNDIIANKIQDNYNAIIVSNSVLEDFEFMRRSTTLVLSVSTLAWWAAWLSDATTIHFPMHGVWHPDVSKHVDNIVTEDRYIYHNISTTTNWSASNEQIQNLLLEY